MPTNACRPPATLVTKTILPSPAGDAGERAADELPPLEVDHAMRWLLRQHHTLDEADLIVNVGPHHVSTHCLIRYVLALNGDTKGLTKIRPGDVFDFERHDDGSLKRMRYPLDEARYLLVGNEEGALSAEVLQRDITIELAEARARVGLSDPTDIELEYISQARSDHCNHNTFRGLFRYLDLETGKTEVIDNLFKTFIETPTMTLKEKHPWVVSVLWDNAGVGRFDSNHYYVITGETHNSLLRIDLQPGEQDAAASSNHPAIGIAMHYPPGSILLAKLRIFRVIFVLWFLFGI